MNPTQGSEPGCRLLVQPRPLARFFPLLPLLGALALGGANLAGLRVEPIWALLFLVLLALLAWWSLAAFRARLELYDWGFLRASAFGVQRLPFDQVETVRLPRAATYGLEPLARSTWRGGGARVALRAPLPMKPCLSAARFALDRVVPRLAAAADARLRRGESLRFGSATATREGLEGRGGRLSWREIERMDFSPRGLRIFPAGHPEATRRLAPGTPNLHVLVALCRLRLEELGAAAPPPPGSVSVGGFPDFDPMLGAVLCGRSRGRAVRSMLVLGAIGLALGALAFQAGVIVGLLVEAALIGVCAWIGLRGGAAVYEKGMRAAGRSLRWDEVEHCTYAVVDQYVNGAYTGRNVTLSLEGGRTRLRFNGGGEEAEGIADAAVNRVLPPMAERAWKLLEAGGSYSSGKLLLKRNAVAWKGEEVPLAQLRTAQAQKGILHVWREGKELSWVMLPLNGKDARVAMLLVDRLLRSR